MDPKTLTLELELEIEELEPKIAPGKIDAVLPAIYDPYGGRATTTPDDSTDSTDNTDTTRGGKGGKDDGGDGGGRGGRK